MTRLGRLAAAIEERTGFAAALRAIAGEPVPGGARWWYALGVVLVALLAVELGTGVLLAFFYAPSAAAAWASTAFIQDTLSLGWFVRGLHSFGSNALLVAAGLHFLQVLLSGAYKAPRELNWMIGLGLFGLVALFALTGSGLPWDQRGYWAKLVEAGIIGATPLVGPWLETVAEGGGGFGNYTLTHYFALHALVLPALTVLLVVVHLTLVRRHKLTPGWDSESDEGTARWEPYWPRQAAWDAALSALALALVVTFVVALHGAALEGPADPASTYQARPEWFARPLYQLRLFFEGPLEPIATLVIPGIAVAYLFAVPFLDRAPTRHPRQRLPVIATTLAGLVLAMALGFHSARKDARDGSYVRHRATIDAEAKLARALATRGVLPEGGVAVYRNDPAFVVRELFREHCAGCHALTGRGAEGEEGGPDLHDYNSRAWITGFLRDPQGPLYMGPAKKPAKGAMKPVRGTDEELAALTELVYSQSAPPDVNDARARQGAELFSSKNCDSCHEIEPGKTSDAPNLLQRGTLAYVAMIIENAGRPELYGERSKMPKFGGKLSREQIQSLAKLIIAQRASPR